MAAKSKTKLVRARVAIGGLKPGTSGHLPAGLADMAIANGHATDASTLAGRLGQKEPSDQTGGSLAGED